MTKRKFGANISAIPEAAPTLGAGIYIGTLTGASVSGKGDKEYINVVPESVWNADAINEKTGKTGAFVHTGDYILQGDIYYRAVLENIEGVQELPQDEVTVPMGRVRLFFDKEAPYAFSQGANKYGVINKVFKQFIDATGIDVASLSIDEAVEYDDSVDPEVPEELAGAKDIIDLLHYRNWYRAYFTLICELINNSKVKVQVKEEPARDNPATMVNVIDTGSYNSFSGILKLDA
jgi:hypothetical protein